MLPARSADCRTSCPALAKNLFQALHERVKNASTVVNFLRIWRSWIFKSKAKSLKTNFLTRQCFNHVILSCHAAVLHIKAAREFSPYTDIILAKTGSDCCEDFFSQNGSWIINHHNYTYADMIEMLPKMNRINEIRAMKDGPVIPKGHKKQLNVWDKGNPRIGPAPNLQNFPDDDELSACWNEGLILAQNICAEVGMKPDQEPENELAKLSKRFAWFYHPHLSDKEAEMLSEMVDDDDEDTDTDDDDKEEDFGDDDDDDKGDDAVDDEDLTAVQEIQEQMNDVDSEDENEEHTEIQGKITKLIEIPGEGKFVYKSTLVSLLNSCPEGKLSKDRLLRVQAGGKNTAAQTSLPSETWHYRNDIGIHSDIAIIKKINGTHVAEYGRVHRIVKKSGRREKIEYRRPVSLNDCEKDSNLQFILTKYKAGHANDIFTFAPGHTSIVSIKDVLMGCEFIMDDNEYYLLNCDDFSSIERILNDRNGRNKRKTLVSAPVAAPVPVPVQTDVMLREDGTVLFEIEASTSKSGRLQRKRRVVLGDG